MSEEDLRFAERCQESLRWDEETYRNIQGKRPDAKYGAVSEFMRHAIKDTTQCALFCGGAKCKYDNPEHWRSDQMEINGLFSNWITDNILAIARPSNQVIEQYDIIGQFKEAGVKSIINLQTPGEHASCGPPLDPSGFSYNPQTFMDNDIFFYNFGWPDYGVGSLSNILDMVKVTQFALTEGKIAVHCHAGLGRTGVLISAYLVYANRMNPHEAIHYMRSKRPGAIQTRNQVEIIEEFGAYLRPLRIVFSSVEKETYDFTLPQYMVRQKKMLHGVEAKNLKYIPKLVFVVCERLIELTQRRSHRKRYLRNTIKVMLETVPAAFNNRRSTETPAGLKPSQSTSRLHPVRSTLSHDSRLSVISASKSMDNLALSGGVLNASSPGALRMSSSPVNLRRAASKGSNMSSVSDSDAAGSSRESSDFLSDGSDTRNPRGLQAGMAEGVALVMAQTEYDNDVCNKVETLKSDLNADLRTWQKLGEETDPQVLSKLMWDWLDHLKEPVLTAQDLPQMLRHTENPPEGLQTLDKITRTTVEYLVGVLTRLQPLSEDTELELLQRIMSTLTHQNVNVETHAQNVNASIASTLSRRTTNSGEMGGSTVWRMMQFFVRYLALCRETMDEACATSESEFSQSKSDVKSGFVALGERREPIGGENRPEETTDSREKPLRELTGRKKNLLEPIERGKVSRDIGGGGRSFDRDTSSGDLMDIRKIPAEPDEDSGIGTSKDTDNSTLSDSLNQSGRKLKKKSKAYLRSRSKQDSESKSFDFS